MNISNIISRVNWVDILSIILLFRIGYIGFNRGLGSEIFPLIGIFTSLVVALHYYLRVGNFFSNHTPLSSIYSVVIAFIGFIFLVNYIFNIAGSFLGGKVVTLQVVTCYDRVGGLIVGLIRGILLVSIILIALELTPVGYIKYSISQRSLMGSKFLSIGRHTYIWTAEFLRLEKRF